MNDEPSDVELMREIAAGDNTAMQLLIERHQQRVYGTAWRICGGNHDAAEETAQEVFIRVFKAAPRYRQEAQFTTWLITICRNCALTRLKRSSRSPLVPAVGDDGTAWESADPRARTADQEIAGRETGEAIQRALAELPEPQRTAVVLREYEDMDYEQIARAMKTSVSAVKSLLFRARGALKEKLAVYLNAT